MIVASAFTKQKGGDSSPVGPLLDQIPGEIEKVTAVGADDGTVEPRGENITVMIPPPVTGASATTSSIPSPNGKVMSLRLLLEDGWAGRKRPVMAGALPGWSTPQPTPPSG